MDFLKYSNKYIGTISKCMSDIEIDDIFLFSDYLMKIKNNQKKLFICGNGGSAANAMHLENDFLYSLNMNVESLTSNSSVLTCLANDVGYENIFSHQLKVKAKKGDILLVLSGSGNSENIIKALEEATRLSMSTFGILGYSGGRAKELVQHPIHFPIDDMQIAEDLQMIVGHMVMQWLKKEKE